MSRHFHYTLALAAVICLLTGCTPSAPKIVTYEMGNRVSVGHLVYTVFETQWLTQLGSGADVRIPEHRFFLVRLSVVNGGSTDLMVPALTLVDDAGQTYTELPNGDQVPEWTGYLRRVKPAETLQGNVVFDVPPKHYRLRITDESSQFARDIDLPLTFASDTPDLPTQQ